MPHLAGPAQAKPSSTSAPDWNQHFARGKVVAAYRSARLQPPESAIFDTLASELAGAVVVDIGVGAGRTAAFLAPRCLRYLGSDIVPAMVQACGERFACEPWHRTESFLQADVCALPYTSASADVVVFSFNGIDHVPQPGRAQALAECRRVLKAGGAFIYSSHNLNWFDSPAVLPRRSTWREWLDDTQHRRKMRRINAATRTRPLAQATLREPPQGLDLYYARPQEHMAQATAAGFLAQRAFDQRGREASHGAAAHAWLDPWVYYLAR